MRILSIAKKEIITTVRNLNVMLIMILMPILLILILGLTFGNSMEQSAMNISDMHVEYTVTGEQAELTDGFKQIMNEVVTGENSTVTLVDDADSAKEKLKDGKIHSYITINENTNTMTVYKNSRAGMESALVEGVLGTYVGRYNAILEIVKVNPRALAEIDVQSGAENYTTLKALGDRVTFGSMDYYGISMVVLFAMYGIMVPFFAIFNERKKRTGDRMLISPINKSDFFLGKLIGTLGSNVLQLGIVIIVSSQVFNVNWGPNPVLVLSLILAEVILAISIGITMGLLIPVEGVAMTLTHMLIGIMAFFGGAYVPLSDIGDLAMVGRYFSPIWWVVTGIINQIYLGDATVLMQAFVVCLGTATVLFTISVIKLSRMEGLHHA